MIGVTARAKINYCLHVLGKREDGYHEIDSLVMFAEFGDEISMAPSDQFSVSFYGEFAQGLDEQNNSIVDAVHWFENYAGLKVKQQFTVQKNIPVMAGLGGGTADAAAAIVALCKFYDVARPDPNELAVLGADVPISFYGRAGRMRGIGEELMPWKNDGFEILLVNPLQSVETKQVFNSPSLVFSQSIESDAWAQTRNDMENAARTVCPSIGEIKSALSNFGAQRVRMTGSGATVFAIGENLGEIANKMNLLFPQYWVRKSVVKPGVLPLDHKAGSTFV